MCGIAGILVKQGDTAPVFDRFERCAQLLRHRGPDAFGRMIERNLALFHYRLSIIDLDPRSNQPFPGNGSAARMVYNGEPYNFRDLAASHDLRLQTTSDTEVVWSLLGKLGPDALAELNGIFALAYWDPAERSLLLARDRLGVKPLYWTEQPDYLAFASEAKVLYEFQERLRLDPQVLAEYLHFGNSVGNQTLVSGVQKLPPGCCLQIDTESGRSSLMRYEPPLNELAAARSQTVVGQHQDSDPVAAVRGLLENAVERQCISDVPVGAYLSGGIDSGALVALASRFLAGRLDTFTVTFDQGEQSELALAAMVARKHGARHHEVHVRTADLEARLADLIYQYDEPFADPAALPLFLLASANQASTRVVLQGDGADELFGGYGRHLDYSQAWLRRLALPALALTSSARHRQSMINRARTLWTRPQWLRLGLSVSEMIGQDPLQVLTAQARSCLTATEPYRHYREVFQGLEGEPELQAMLFTDMQAVLPNRFLEKVDKVSMMYSIEARVPYLDNELVDYVMALDSRLKVRGGVSKVLLREATRDLLPDEVLNARKVSFGTPMGTWLRTTLQDFAWQRIDDARRRWSGLMDCDALTQLMNAVVSRTASGPESALLWRAIVLIVWLERYVAKIDLSLLEDRPAHG
ncbi:MAG: asparagine synthase (glutamine-hydrolyzing) [Wenzhouxiangella sp.]|nr:asparagine synthase (glutamine-hydrolyzing) [Wenzhouxiangella sp.]